MARGAPRAADAAGASVTAAGLLDVLADRARWHVHTSEALDSLRLLPDESVQCVVTSPPYWRQRDYGHADQLGLETNPIAYVERLVAIFREVRRVLRADGTVWINLGDSYSSSGRGQIGDASTLGGSQRAQMSARGDALKQVRAARTMPGRIAPGPPPKNLLGIPWRVAFALQDDGWFLRSEIIWAKPNPQPESVKDRPTRAHEHLFLLSRSETYAYDADAIREHHIDRRAKKAGKTARRGQASMKPTGKADGPDRWYHKGGRNCHDVWLIAGKGWTPGDGSGDHYAVMPEELALPCVLAGCPDPNGIVLDPFAGTSTTGVVALARGRRYLGIELSPTYAAMSAERIVGDQPLLRAPPSPPPASAVMPSLFPVTPALCSEKP